LKKRGSIGIWSKNFTFQKSYQISEDVEDSIYLNKSVKYGKKTKTSLWITDAVIFLENNMICIATSRRDLRFFTISSEHFLEDFCIYGEFLLFLSIPEVPLINLFQNDSSS
jgi:hypothetical protein